MENRLLFISNLGGSISYTDVSFRILNILNERAKNTELFIFSTGKVHELINYSIPEKTGVKQENVYTISSANTINNTNWFNKEYHNNVVDGYLVVGEIIQRIDPNIIFILNDNMYVNRMTEAIANTRPKYSGKIVCYVPIDMGNFCEKTVNVNCNLIFSPTDFTRDIIMKHQTDIPVVTLPHPITNKQFYRINEYDVIPLKKKYLGLENIDKFVVGAVNANSIRKRWDLVLKSFQIYHKLNPESILLIKTSKIQNGSKDKVHSRGINLRDELDKYEELKSAIIMIEGKLPIKELNEIYNCVDIFINCTDGEGFGLIPFECALTGRVTLLPNYTSFSTLFDANEKFMMPCDIYPAKLIRDNDTVDNVLNNNLYYCIYYSSKNYRESEMKVENNMLGISKGIKTIYITTDGSDKDVVNINPVNACSLFIHLRTLRRALELIKTLNKLPNEFQILISCSSTIIEEVYKTLLIHNAEMKDVENDRTVVVVNPHVMKSYRMKDAPHVGIVYPDDVANRLVYYEENRGKLAEDGLKCLRFVENNLNDDVFFDILNRSLREIDIDLIVSV